MSDAPFKGLLSPVESAYVHIPFCKAKCSYCDFVSYPGESPELQKAYCVSLQREIRQTALWAQQQPEPLFGPLRTVFVGGGTPTILPPGQLARILDTFIKAFGLDPQGEYTLEANPGTVTAAGLRECRLAGYNRISFGLQAIQPHLLQTLGRIHNQEDFQRSVDQAVAAGFSLINADIMFGLPGQTLDDVSKTVQWLIRLPVNHVSFYALSLEEGTPLQKICSGNPALLPAEEVERAQYHLVRDSLQKAGFLHYEISNAARPGFFCQHNLTYWQAKSYYGFGAAAHSFLQGARLANTTGLKAYLAAFSPAGKKDVPFPAAKLLEIINETEAKKEMLLLGLRLLEGVSNADFMARFGSDLYSCFGDKIDQLVRRGLLFSDGQGIRLTSFGLDLANQVFMEFV